MSETANQINEQLTNDKIQARQRIMGKVSFINDQLSHLAGMLENAGMVGRAGNVNAYRHKLHNLGSEIRFEIDDLAFRQGQAKDTGHGQAQL